ncbi:MAG TPA: DUF4386 domain-containing protein [Alphaproteobacteria bacterium]|nr:DUF4386 domain-containing protein [Alphaproteobacteria bacterium]
MERIAEASPRFKARIAGLFYFLTFLTAIPVVIVSSKIVVLGDAAATATNILAHEPLFRLGFAAYVVNLACYVVVTALFYRLFKPASRSLSLIAASFSIVACSIQAVSTAFYLAPLVLLRDAQYLSAFKLEQTHALALMSIKLHTQTYNIGLVFFGFYCFFIGCLILRSTFLPRILGGLMALGGLGWLTFISAPLAKSLSPYNLGLGVLGELSLTLWLLVMSVNTQRWKEQAGYQKS